MKKKIPTERPAEATPTSKRTDPASPPSPSERHPGLKPEEADGKFEDLEVRESGNRR
jgi:hypothetical protein